MPAWTRPRSALPGALAVGLALAVSTAQADFSARRAVPLLARPEAQHSLLDRSGRLPLLVPLPEGVSASERGLLPVAPGFGAIHLAPSELGAFVQAQPDLEPRLAPPRRLLLDVAGGWTRAPAFRNVTGLDGTAVVVGIVDTGLDVAHPDFRRGDGSTRIAWMLVSGAPLGKHPDLEQRFGCDAPGQSPCAILDAADIDALLATPDATDEPRDPSGHGTHVTSIAAGNGGPMVSDHPRYVGMAPGATLVIAAPSAHAQFSDPDILNAARFVFDRAEALGMPAVVNLSLGSDFGPHDGSSALEQGLAAMVGDSKPGRAVVVAAGNSGALYRIGDLGPYGIHTEVHVSPDSLVRIPMTVPGYQGSVHGSGFVWITFRPGDDVSVGLDGPDGDGWIGMTAPGEEQGYEADEGATTAAVVNNTPGANAGITPDTNSAVALFDGTWEASSELAVLLRGHGTAELWVSSTEDLAPGPVSVGLSFAKALRAGTIGVPASDPRLLSVGCTLNRVAWRPHGTLQSLGLVSFGGVPDPIADSVCYFSGAGPNPAGAMKPELVAPGAYVAAAMSRDADPRAVASSMFSGVSCPADMPGCTVVDDWHAVGVGTSMSAPFVAGAAALLLQRDPSLTQAGLTDLLQAGAARPRGLAPYDYQLGPGELDLGGALQALEQQPGGSEPDVAQSYYVLSSPVARPDPGWPVEAVIQLRRSDGSVASGIGGQALSVHLAGAMLTQPVTRSMAGTWTFAFAAPVGSGGGTVTVDVRYAGASLGARTLPIGVDAWAARSGIDAVGGCSLGAGAPAGEPSSRRAALLALLMVGCARHRRRRRQAVARHQGNGFGQHDGPPAVQNGSSEPPVQLQACSPSL
jgi:subtilisin family serine protease